MGHHVTERAPVAGFRVGSDAGSLAFGAVHCPYDSGGNPETAGSGFGRTVVTLIQRLEEKGHVYKSWRKRHEWDGCHAVGRLLAGLAGIMPAQRNIDVCFGGDPVSVV